MIANIFRRRAAAVLTFALLAAPLLLQAADDGSALGEVRKLDAEAGKITLKHGEIASLDMPPMTMVFDLKDKALLTGLKPGDKVRFKATKEGGRFTVTEIQPVK